MQYHNGKIDKVVKKIIRGLNPGREEAPERSSCMNTLQQKYSKREELGQVRTINQSELDSSCWQIQVWGKDYCKTCEFDGTPDCGGNIGNAKLIREGQRQVKSKPFRHKIDYFDKLDEFYQGDIPEYILKAGKTFIKIKVSDWRGEQDLRVTLKNVVNYYYYGARNITSGCRTLAGYTSDWRPIDTLAKECLEWFKFINIEELRTISRKYGLIPKF